MSYPKGSKSMGWLAPDISVNCPLPGVVERAGPATDACGLIAGCGLPSPLQLFGNGTTVACSLDWLPVPTNSCNRRDDVLRGTARITDSRRGSATVGAMGVLPPLTIAVYGLRPTALPKRNGVELLPKVDDPLFDDIPPSIAAGWLGSWPAAAAVVKQAPDPTWPRRARWMSGISPPAVSTWSSSGSPIFSVSWLLAKRRIVFQWTSFYVYD